MTENKGKMQVEDDDLWDDDDEDSMKNRYLTFRVGDEDYGVEIVYVTEIVGMQGITEVPDMPDFVKGVINLRGQVIPVIDVRTRFKLSFREYDDRTCFVVANINNSSIGLIVDTVSEVINIPEDQVSPPPEINAGESARYIQGMGKVGEEIKILLDIQQLLLNEEQRPIEA